MSKKTSVLFAYGIQQEAFDERDLPLIKAAYIFPPDTTYHIEVVEPQTYGDLYTLSKRLTREGERAYLLIDLINATKGIDLCVDLALFLMEHTRKKPVCIYLEPDAKGKRSVTVKYPTPLNTEWP